MDPTEKTGSGVAVVAEEVKKIYILDTSVLVYDPESLLVFKDNDVVVPSIVIDELDNLMHNPKKSESASEANKALCALTNGHSIRDGIKLPGGGTLRVDMDGDDLDLLPHGWRRDNNDHIILLSAMRIKKANPNRKVIVVSKDYNFRLKANCLGVPAEDYRNDNIDDLEKMFMGIFNVMVNDQVIVDIHQRQQHQHGTPILVDNAGLDDETRLKLCPNMCCRLKGRFNGATALAIYKAADGTFNLVDKPQAKKSNTGVVARNDEQAFALNLAMDPSIGVLTLYGSAGTGKSLMALQAGWQYVIDPGQKFRAGSVDTQDDEDCTRIQVFRPTHELGNEMGYIPGTVEDKFAPWQRPTFTGLKLVAGRGNKDRIFELIRQDKIEILGINHIRGDTFNNAFLIVDDAQNFKPKEMLAILTRVGQGTKVIINGDLDQVDVEGMGRTSNGLAHTIARLRGQEGCASLRLVKGERSWIAALAAKLL